jgi:hypothetical protein
MRNQIHWKKIPGLAFVAIMASALVFILGAGTSVSAQTAHADRAKEEKSEGRDANPRAAGQQAAIDPQTKKLRQPTPEEAKELSEAMQKLGLRATENLKATYFANGTVMVELPEEYMEVSVIKINPDGTKTVECVTGLKAAEELLKANAAANSVNPGSTKGAPAAGPAQKSTEPSVKGETGKAPQKTNPAKDKEEIM